MQSHRSAPTRDDRNHRALARMAGRGAPSPLSFNLVSSPRRYTCNGVVQSGPVKLVIHSSRHSHHITSPHVTSSSHTSSPSPSVRAGSRSTLCRGVTHSPSGATVVAVSFIAAHAVVVAVRQGRISLNPMQGSRPIAHQVPSSSLLAASKLHSHRLRPPPLPHASIRVLASCTRLLLAPTTTASPTTAASACAVSWTSAHLEH